jgi:hypothetical protein
MKNKTIFCDIDGTLFKYRDFKTIRHTEPELTPGSYVKMNKWASDGHCIVITTARPESMREHTINELSNTGIPFDQLIMGIGGDSRHIINDNCPKNPTVPRAGSFSLLRDEGMKNITISRKEKR